MMMVVAQEGNPTVIMLMWAKSSAELRGEILAGQLQLRQNPDLEISSQQEIKTIRWNKKSSDNETLNLNGERILEHIQ